MNKTKYLKRVLEYATGCTIQHNGWPCGTCFFDISETLNNADWHLVLFMRGDYTSKELDNLPKPSDQEESYQKIIRICEQEVLDNEE